MPGPLARVLALNPFTIPETRRFALLFAVVYFAQGMWSLPTQAMTIFLKNTGLKAGEVADFQLMATLPWLIKPLYGLLSDFVPLWGRRRKGYFLLASGLAAASGFTLAAMPEHTYWRMALVYTAMGFGLAFTDVLVDALMVENGRRHNLTGAFQSVQWASIYGAVILVGILGGHFAKTGNLNGAFLLAGCFPLVSFAMAAAFIHEPRATIDREALRETLAAIVAAARGREIWVVAGFVFLFNFSPSFGPAFLYYQTDVLKFDQQFIGLLGSLTGVGAIAGAAVYAPLSRRMRLRPLIVTMIGASAAATFAYLLYRDRTTAVLIDTGFGVLALITQLAFLDLAARACPRRVEGTFFALLMAVYNGGAQLSTNVGGRLYDCIGFAPLVCVSATLTAAAWLLVPLVRIDAIEARARADAPATDQSRLTSRDLAIVLAIVGTLVAVCVPPVAPPGAAHRGGGLLPAAWALLPCDAAAGVKAYRAIDGPALLVELLVANGFAAALWIRGARRAAAARRSGP